MPFLNQIKMEELVMLLVLDIDTDFLSPQAPSRSPGWTGTQWGRGSSGPSWKTLVLVLG